MKAADTKEEIYGLFNNRALSSVFIDSGLNIDLTQRVLDVWDGFNSLTGPHWNLIFPVYPDEGVISKPAYTISSHMNASRYNPKISQMLAKEFGLANARGPFVAFVGHDKNDYFILSLADLEERQWRKTFEDISEICDRVAYEKAHESDEYFKDDIAAAVRAHLGIHARWRVVKKVGGAFSGIFGVVASVVSLATLRF